MKQKILLSTALLLSSFSQAQVPNGGFEILTPENHVSQWVKNYMLSVVIDSTGEFHGDSIVFDNPDNQLYRSMTDAHTGQYALEMTNGFNYTTNSGMVGGAFLASSEFYSALSPEVVYMNPIQPETFSFYYKYFPLATDSAQVILNLFDIDGFPIGNASTVLGGITSSYTFVDLPIQYDVDVPAYAMSISFLTAVPGNRPTLGTKFIVDDVALNGNLGIANNPDFDLAIYPNPATESFQISGAKDNQITILSSTGTLLEVKSLSAGLVDCSNWANGIYFIQLTNGEQSLIKKIVISH